MRALNRRFYGGLTIFALALGGAAACQNPPAANVNTSTVNGNTQTTVNVNSATIPTESSVVNTREPEMYRGTMVFTQAQMTGQQQQNLSLPSIEVARNAADRRYAINVPALGQVIFLDRADKQYAELTPELTGLDLRSMTPGQMVTMLQKQRGVQEVGEEQLNGRTVMKYRYAATANTGSPAGSVKSESFIFVDKETGLPLRIEGFGQSSGNVQGVSGGQFVVEMRDVQTQVDPALFELPQGYAQLTTEQLKQQAAAVASFLQIFLKGMSAQTAAGATPATTPASASPTVTVSPTATP
jgi:hypothetical protein